MKYLLALLMFVSFSANAQCFVVNGLVQCQQIDYRTDYNSPKLIDQNGTYRGNLNGNVFDPNSVSNPYGRYGSPYSPDSLNNPYNPANNLYFYPR